MASDRAIAQAFRECDGMEFVDAAGRSSLNWIAKRAERIDATPPAGAGEAVLWVDRDDVRKATEGLRTVAAYAHAAVQSGRIANPETLIPLYAAPTPLPEAVRELAGKWRAEALRLAENPDHTDACVGQTYQECADELDRALTGGDKQGDSSPTGDA